MEAENDIAKTRRDMRELLEQLSLPELRSLLNMPILNADVLEHAAESELLARRVEEALDAEYSDMPPSKREELDRRAALIAARCGARLGDDSLDPLPKSAFNETAKTDFGSMPPWIHLSHNFTSNDISMTAQQETNPGWPLVLSMDAEGLSTLVELKFDWHLSFLVVELLTSLDQEIEIAIKLSDMKREIQLRYRTKAILGRLDAFRLTEKSNETQIVSALVTFRFMQPRMVKSS